MKLSELISQIPWGEKINAKNYIANKACVTLACMDHWIDERRKPQPKYLRKIELAASEVAKRYGIDGCVTIQDLRPDIFAD